MSRSSLYGISYAPPYIIIPLEVLMIFGESRVQKFESTTEFYPGGRLCDDPCIGQNIWLPLGSEHQVYVHTAVSLHGTKWSVTIEVFKKIPEGGSDLVFGVHQGPLCSDLKDKWEIRPCDFPRLYGVLESFLPEPLRDVRLEECSETSLPERVRYAAGNPHHIEEADLMRILRRLRVRLSD